ncbi:DUF3947 family protein [Bacillus sp. JJ1127]
MNKREGLTIHVNFAHSKMNIHNMHKSILYVRERRDYEKHVFYNKNRIPSITYSAAHGMVQTVQQAIQAQILAMQAQEMQFYDSTTQQYYPMYVTQSSVHFSIIPFGSVYNL